MTYRPAVRASAVPRETFDALWEVIRGSGEPAVFQFFAALHRAATCASAPDGGDR